MSIQKAKQLICTYNLYIFNECL